MNSQSVWSRSWDISISRCLVSIDCRAEIISRAGRCVERDNAQDWITWDSGLSVKAYASKMRTGSHWGGAIEMAVLSMVDQVNVHVFERRGTKFVRISAFDCNGSANATTTINVVYGGGVHYDALKGGKEK